MFETFTIAFDFLGKYELRILVGSLIFSFILVGIYYKFHHIPSVEDRVREKELEVTRQYEEKLNTLNTQLNASKEKIIELKSELISSERNNKVLNEKLLNLANEISNMRVVNSFESLKTTVESVMNNIKTYNKES